MTGLRRGMLLTSAERYVVLANNLLVIAVASRLLTPSEVGLAVLGTSLLSIAETLRDFGTSSYLVQKRDLTHAQVRTSFTIACLTALLLASALLLSTGWLVSTFQDPRLADFLQVIAIALLTGPFAAPVWALLRRDMAFATLAGLNIGGALIYAAVTIGCASLGFGYMSFAWGGLAWGVGSIAMAIWARRDLSIYRPSLADWREVIAFGGYSSATVVLNRFYEVLPSLVLGRLLSTASVGLFARATMVSQMPDRLLLAGAMPAVLPALAAEVRAGRDLKRPYLRALGYITVIQWPGLVLTALLAHPIVVLFLGPQWLDAVVPAQIMAVAWLWQFPAHLSYPVFVAVGAIRHLLVSTLISLPVSTALLVAGALVSLEAVALTYLIALPLQVFVTLGFIRRHVRFSWSELVSAVSGSAAVTACTAAGPVFVLAAAGFRFDVTVGAMLLAVAAAALGWLCAVVLLKHPIAGELRYAVVALRRGLSACQMILLDLRPRRLRRAPSAD